MSGSCTIPASPAISPPSRRFRLLESLISANDGELFVAEEDGAFVGYAAGFVLRDDNPAETEDSNVCGYINDVYVVPHRRGRGIASLLLQAVEDYLRAKGMARLRINTLVDNELAKRAYIKNGFAPYEVMMEKLLKQP